MSCSFVDLFVIYSRVVERRYILAILNHPVQDKKARVRARACQFLRRRMSAIGALLTPCISEESCSEHQLRSLLSAYGGSKRAARTILCRYRCYEPMNRAGFARYDDGVAIGRRASSLRSRIRRGESKSRKNERQRRRQSRSQLITNGRERQRRGGPRDYARLNYTTAILRLAGQIPRVRTFLLARKR